MAEEVNEERQAKRETLIEGQYAALGKFIQEFSQICFCLRLSFVFLIQAQGLKDQQVGHIIINHKNITADALLEIMASLVGYLRKDDQKGLEIFNHITKRFLALIELRNDITHGNWFIGWGNAEKTD